MGGHGGGYAEYALSWAYTTFHIPKTISFEGGLPKHSVKAEDLPH
jgi:hypothetical protein